MKTCTREIAYKKFLFLRHYRMMWKTYKFGGYDILVFSGFVFDLVFPLLFSFVYFLLNNNGFCLKVEFVFLIYCLYFGYFRATTTAALEIKQQTNVQQNGIMETSILPSSLTHEILVCDMKMKPLGIYAEVVKRDEWKKILIFVNRKYVTFLVFKAGEILIVCLRVCENHSKRFRLQIADGIWLLVLFVREQLRMLNICSCWCFVSLKDTALQRIGLLMEIKQRVVVYLKFRWH